MDKVIDNISYVLTQIENEPYILCLSKCNYCPFFLLNEHDFDCFCLKNNGRKLIKRVNSISYVGNMRYTFNEVKCPDWCELSKLVMDGDIDQYLYYKDKSNNIITEEAGIPEFFPMIFDSELKYGKGKIVRNIKSVNETNETNRINLFNEETNKKIEIDTKNICSCCGIKKENVDRTKNLGMCDECYKKIIENKDKETICFIYLNNFRLKRKSTYCSSKFKNIIDNNYYCDKIVV